MSRIFAFVPAFFMALMMSTTFVSASGDAVGMVPTTIGFDSSVLVGTSQE